MDNTLTYVSKVEFFSMEIVKICPCCQIPFTLEELANNPEIRLIGMSFGEDSIEWAYYFFQHEASNCGSSFVVKIESFLSLINEPVPTEKMALRDCCEEHCVNINDLSSCKNECYFAPFRRLLLEMIAAKSAIAVKNSIARH